MANTVANSASGMANDVANERGRLLVRAQPSLEVAQSTGNRAGGGVGQTKPSEQSAPTYRYRDAEKRRAYQKEYMRNRRKKPLGIAYG